MVGKVVYRTTTERHRINILSNGFLMDFQGMLEAVDRRSGKCDRTTHLEESVVSAALNLFVYHTSAAPPLWYPI